MVQPSALTSCHVDCSYWLTASWSQMGSATHSSSPVKERKPLLASRENTEELPPGAPLFIREKNLPQNLPRCPCQDYSLAKRNGVIIRSVTLLLKLSEVLPTKFQIICVDTAQSWCHLVPYHECGL